jgi:hypothetical protein
MALRDSMSKIVAVGRMGTNVGLGFLMWTLFDLVVREISAVQYQ